MKHHIPSHADAVIVMSRMRTEIKKGKIEEKDPMLSITELRKYWQDREGHQESEIP